jgi:hypothetical protein
MTCFARISGTSRINLVHSFLFILLQTMEEVLERVFQLYGEENPIVGLVCAACARNPETSKAMMKHGDAPFKVYVESLLQSVSFVSSP